jgi:hypothetical protein
MADAPAAAPAKSGSTFGFLGKKVFGKIPVWVIAVAGVGAYYWYTKYGPGKKNAAGQMQTDPAGNQCGVINPDTGYCPGTPEDTAALASGAASGTDTSGAAAGTGTSGGGSTGDGGGTTGDGTGSSYVPPSVTAAPPGTTNPTGADIPVALPGTTPVSPASVAAYSAAQSAAAHKAHVAHQAHLAHLAHVKATAKTPPKRGKK